MSWVGALAFFYGVISSLASEPSVAGQSCSAYVGDEAVLIALGSSGTSPEGVTLSLRNAQLSAPSHEGERLILKHVYPGIDWIWYEKEGLLEYDFRIAPGFSPHSIHLVFSGMETLELQRDGSLALRTERGYLVQKAPLTYQEIDGRCSVVDSRYRVLEDGRSVAIVLGEYDKQLPLMIDPILVYKQTLTDSSPYLSDIAEDAQGNLYLSGLAAENDKTKALVTKLLSNGEEAWSLHLGGAEHQIATSVAVDDSGNVYVAGWTSSADFPVKAALQGSYGGGESDVFLAKINASGSGIVYATFFGGSGEDLPNQLKVDQSGAVYLVGTTNSANFPLNDQTVSGESDGFILKVNAQGTKLEYGRLIGGSGTDLLNGLALSDDGRAWAIGTSGSVDIALIGALQSELGGTADVLMVGLDPSGVLDYATLLGGSGPEFGNGIALDAEGNVLVTGVTFSQDFPLVEPWQNTLRQAFCRQGDICGDAFVSKLRQDGKQLLFSSYLGGNGAENNHALISPTGLAYYGIAVDPDGFIYLTGSTESSDFPQINGLSLSGAFGGKEIYLTKLNPSGSPVYSTYLRSDRRFDDRAATVIVNAHGVATVAASTLPFSLDGGSDPTRSAQGFIARVFDLPIAAQPALPAVKASLPIKDLRLLADGSRQMTVSVPPAGGYVIESSEDLRTWTPLETVPVSGGNGGGGVKQ